MSTITTAQAYAAPSATEDLGPTTIKRRGLGASDVKIDILYCGVCHSDLHAARNDWGNARFPLVPGHEIIGRVMEVGAEVSRFAEGDLVGVGCMVDSCQHCDSCAEDLEQYCENGSLSTYNSPDPHFDKQQPTYGGYSDHVVVDEKFVLTVPANIDPAGAAPLLCAGITTYSPLRQWNVKAGDKVGVIGLGGLGHMGIKFASAMGATVVAISRSPEKEKDATDLGAHAFINSKNRDEMKEHKNSFDLILNTIPVGHDVNPYLALLKRDKTMVIVGAIEPIDKVNGAHLILKRKRIAGSLIGGIAETQEMLDFCGEHGITSDIEVINMDYINTAFDRMQESDVKYRFVIDMASLKR